MSYLDKGNTYGAHLLVDFTPIQEADKLLEECNQVLVQMTGGQSFAQFGFARVANVVQSFRTKRKDSKIISLYEGLTPRINATETKLRNIIIEVAEKKVALRMHANHLQARLHSCINFNKTLLSESEGPLEELRSFVNRLSGESSQLKEMMVFNKEIIRFKNLEQVSKGQSFVRWAPSMKPPKRTAVSESDLMKDDMHPDIETRLIVLRKIRERFVAFLANLLETRGTQLANLDNCEKAMQLIDGIISRNKGLGIEDTKEIEKEEKYTYDHSRCADCSYGYSMTYDCTNHLAALRKQALEANTRLQSIVEIRERIADENERLTLLESAKNEGNDKNGQVLLRENAEKIIDATNLISKEIQKSSSTTNDVSKANDKNSNSNT